MLLLDDDKDDAADDDHHHHHHHHGWHEVPFVQTCWQFGKMRGVPARGGYPARGILMLHDPLQAKEHHEWGPLHPFELKPEAPLPANPPPAPLWEVQRGEGSRLERGSRLVAVSVCGRFGRGNTTSRDPSRAGTPCLSWAQALLIFGTVLFHLVPLFGHFR